MNRVASLGPLALLASCRPNFRDCDPIDPAELAALPDRLSATGLFVDLETEALAPNVRAFTPRFSSWTDGATKRRWIDLPAPIDTTDPNAWNFPVGTKLWKELARDGTRIETRLLFKHGPAPDAWTPLAYVWRDDGDAYATPDGQVDARGTDHDVPSAGTCIGCHGGSPSGVLGFTAIQLARAELDALPVTTPIPPTALPGDATTQAALGYLHANCSHCHNANRPAHDGPRCYDPERSFSFQLRVGELATPEATATYRTAIGRVIDAGDPGDSEILDRMRAGEMPALGTEHVDEAGVRQLSAWIERLH